MTDPALTRPGGHGAAAGGADLPRSGFNILLNVAAILLVVFFLWRAGVLHQPLWVVILSTLGLLGWLLREFLPARSTAQLLAILVAVVSSSLVAVSTSVTGYLAALVCLAALLATPRRPLALGIAAALASALLVAVSALAIRAPIGVLLGAAAGLVIAILIGVGRRQSRVALARERDLLEERLRLEEERARTAALAERSRIARDIHDVLAHSLGGLVLQLDAVEALLEADRVDDARLDDARARVTAARGLAASGLDEARRAVDALRDPETSTDLSAALAELLATHRSLGAAATLAKVRTGPPRPVSPEAAGTLRRAAQEALSNARRHAPNQQTDLTLTDTPDAITLVASTPVVLEPTPLSSVGGGRGLAGLRERVTALGGIAEWGVREGAFVVTASVPRQVNPPPTVPRKRS